MASNAGVISTADRWTSEGVSAMVAALVPGSPANLPSASTRPEITPQHAKPRKQALEVPETRLTAEQALANLAELCSQPDDDELFKEMDSAGAIPALVDILLRSGGVGRGDNVSVQRAARLLGCLANNADKDRLNTLRVAGVAPALVGVLRDGEMQEWQSDVVWAVRHFFSPSKSSCCVEAKEALLDAGLIPAMVPLLGQSASGSCQFEAARTFAELTDSPETAKQVLAAGAALPLVTLLRETTSVDCLDITCRVIGNLCRHCHDSRSANRVVAAGLLPALEKLLRTERAAKAWDVCYALAYAMPPASTRKSPYAFEELAHSLSDWLSRVDVTSSPRDVASRMTYIRDIFLRMPLTCLMSASFLPELVRFTGPCLETQERDHLVTLLECVKLLCPNRDSSVPSDFCLHLLLQGIATRLWLFVAEDGLAEEDYTEQGPYMWLKRTLMKCITAPGLMLGKAMPTGSVTFVQKGIATLALAFATSQPTPDSARQACRLLECPVYSRMAAEAMLMQVDLGNRARICASELYQRDILITGQGQPHASDDTRPVRRLRFLREDFNNPDIPGCLCFIIAGRKYYGSAHLLRGCSHTLREGIDSLSGGGASMPGPIPLHGPASIPEEQWYEVFVACMKHAYFEDSVAKLGVDLAQLWECARWLQMDELIAQCEAEVTNMLLECDEALQAANVLEGAVFGMLRHCSSGAFLVAACGKMLVRWGSSDEVAELLTRLGREEEEDELRKLCVDEMADVLRRLCLL